MNTSTLDNLSPRELLQVIDRSDPQVRALADHLERVLNGLDELSWRLKTDCNKSADLAGKCSEISRHR